MSEHSRKALLNGTTTVTQTAQRATDLCTRIFAACGLPQDIATQVSTHLADSDLCGTPSHGLVRTLQYARELQNGKLNPKAKPKHSHPAQNHLHIDANGAVGIPPMRDTILGAAQLAKSHGLAMATLKGAGHTGRLGEFAQEAAQKGALTITLGGGNRKTWRMVAPYGSTKALLPTNPYCIGLPGGENGPVVLDCATSQLAGGWIYAARAAGTDLPEGAVIDANGNPTHNPEDYFDGGAILPKGGPLGSGLALIAELLGEALLGPVDKGEINWLTIAVDCTKHRAPEAFANAAEEILAEIRNSPPAPGHDQVFVPGERERILHAKSDGKITLPAPIWQSILDLAHSLNIPTKTGA